MIVILVVIGLGTVFAQSPLLKEFNDGSTLFTADVYRQLANIENGNFLVCPISVDIAMAFAQAGAKGETSLQISRGLHLSEDPERVQNIIRQLSPNLQQTNEFYNLTSANKMYVKKGFQISDNYKRVAVDVFNSEIENIDFVDRELAASKMNKWVEDKTHNKIKNLIQKDDIDRLTRLVLINAIYFHGIWVNQFDKDATRERPFFLNNQQQVKVPMMETLAEFKYHDSQELKSKILVLPYKGDFSMVIVLPNSKDGLPELESQMSRVLSVSSQTSKFSIEHVHAIIPKFKIETTIKFVPILQALGVIEPFEDTADFSGIGANNEPLKISKVIQKAFVEVEEEGTTAAAATADFVDIKIGSGNILQFNANRPFIFILRSNRAGILFMGRYKASNAITFENRVNVVSTTDSTGSDSEWIWS